MTLPRVEFVDGTYATFREKLNVRGRKAMERTSIPAIKAMRRIRQARKAQEIAEGTAVTPTEQLGYTETEIDAMQRFEMAGVMAMLAHWTREDPVPRTIDEIEDMDPDDYERLAVVVRPHLWTLMGRPGMSVDDAINEDGTKNLESPTGPSNGSESGDSEPRATQLPDPPSEIVTENSSPGTASTSSEVVTPA